MQTHKPKATNLLHLFLHNTFTTTNFKYHNKEIFVVQNFKKYQKVLNKVKTVYDKT